MANFFTDNQDIVFLFDHLDLARSADSMEDSYGDAGQYDYAPANAAEAMLIRRSKPTPGYSETFSPISHPSIIVTFG